MKSLLISILLVPSFAFSAIPSKKTNSEFEKALSAPLKIAVSEIYKMGPTAYRELNNIAFDATQSMNVRWKSFMVMTTIGGDKSLPEIDKALRDSVWFMRSAGLLAMQKVDRDKAINWARHLFKNDPALLVRLKATDVLRTVPDDTTKDLFWEKLYSKDNFHRDESLWIRDKIAAHLADYPRKQDFTKWKKALFDGDLKVQNQAVRAIEKITGQAKEGDEVSRVSFWQSKYMESKKL